MDFFKAINEGGQPDTKYQLFNQLQPFKLYKLCSIKKTATSIGEGIELTLSMEGLQDWIKTYVPMQQMQEFSDTAIKFLNDKVNAQEPPFIVNLKLNRKGRLLLLPYGKLFTQLQA